MSDVLDEIPPCIGADITSAPEFRANAQVPEPPPPLAQGMQQQQQQSHYTATHYEQMRAQQLQL